MMVQGGKMQHLGSVRAGVYSAYGRGARGDGGIGNRQTEGDVGSSADAKPLYAPESIGTASQDSSSEKLKDAFLMSIINWLSEHLKTVAGTGGVSISSGNKSVSGTNLSIVAEAAANGTVDRIAAEGDISLRAQANVAEDTALHLLSAGALAETVQEPGHKHQTLFEADDVDLRIRAKVSQTPF